MLRWNSNLFLPFPIMHRIFTLWLCLNNASCRSLHLREFEWFFLTILAKDWKAVVLLTVIHKIASWGQHNIHVLTAGWKWKPVFTGVSHSSSHVSLSALWTDNRRWWSERSAPWSSSGRRWRRKPRGWWRRSRRLPLSFHNILEKLNFEPEGTEGGGVKDAQSPLTRLQSHQSISDISLLQLNSSSLPTLSPAAHTFALFATVHPHPPFWCIATLKDTL